MGRAPYLFALTFAACVAASAGSAAAAEAARACDIPGEIIADDPKLPQTAAALHGKTPLTIVAIGGASTAGNASGNGEAYGYPRQVQDILRARHPDASITVVNKGVPRQTTEEMTARFDKDVVPYRPALVLWETGTVDAVRGMDVDAFAAALQDGIAALRQHNFDIMLIDMQYNPRTGSVIDVGPYLEALRKAADLENVYHFRRYELMRYWSENGIFDFADVPKEKRAVLAQEVYRCLGEALADAIGHAVQ